MQIITSTSSPPSSIPGLQAWVDGQGAHEQIGAIMATNTDLAGVGDSLIANNSFANADYIKAYAKGHLNFATYIARQRCTFDHANNFGIAGNNTNDVAARMANILKTTTAATIVLDCGTNDAPNGVSFENTKTNIKTMIKQIIDSGRICVLLTPCPRDKTALAQNGNSLTMTDAQQRTLLARRDWYINQHNPRAGVYVVDSWRYLADPASLNGAMRAGYAYDGVHTGFAGSYWRGMALAEFFGVGRGPGFFPFIERLPGQNIDVWNASYPRGCVNNNPMMQGGATAATGYTIGGGSGVAATGTKVSPGNGRTDIQQIALSTATTANGNADIYDFYQTLPTANLAIGDRIRAYAEVDYDGITGLSSHGLVLVETPGFTRSVGFLVDSTEINAIPMTGIPMTGVMRTPELILTGTGVRCGMKGRSINGQAVAGTYRIGAMSVRKAA